MNKTRDVEARAFRELLSKINFSDVIELGCGTGKNTEWLVEKAVNVIAVDFSEKMLNLAKNKISKSNIEFVAADISKPWNFTDKKADLIISSLILEHVENIEFVFHEASRHLKTKGWFYVGELHPFKQYEGTKARFESGSGTVTLECYTHHASDYMTAATKNQLSCVSLTEWFDEGKNSIPRIIAFLFQKK